MCLYFSFCFRFIIYEIQGYQKADGHASPGHINIKNSITYWDETSLASLACIFIIFLSCPNSKLAFTQTQYCRKTTRLHRSMHCITLKMASLWKWHYFENGITVENGITFLNGITVQNEITLKMILLFKMALLFKMTILLKMALLWKWHYFENGITLKMELLFKMIILFKLHYIENDVTF